ncbi:hypothetical protein PZA11_005604 [Diplocarpon coronariae]
MLNFVQIARIANSNQLGIVISKMEKIFESITDCILDEKKELVIRLKSRSKKRQVLDENDSEAPEKSTKITFPSKNAKEAWKFTALLRILELSHEALVTGIVTTKRDIYYRDPELFMKQVVVDRYVDDIAYTFGVGRDALNVVAAAKGLVAGSFLVTRKDESVIDFTAEPEGLLIPNPTDMDVIQFIHVRWILVVEKEATFRTLATARYWKCSIAGKGLLITAKGYPDIQTRQFLHILSTHHPAIPILALVDFDPDGIGIMSTYKYGSQALAHEANLAVPSVRWLGVQSHDFLEQDEGVQGLLKMSARDRRIARKMLERVSGEHAGVEEEWMRELQVMLMLNVKAEIQILGNGEKLGEWLDSAHITAFLILHELTAILPLVGLAVAFHYTNWLPEAWVQGRWVAEGTERFGRYFGRKGWFGFGTIGVEGSEVGKGDEGGGGEGGIEELEQQVERKWHAGSQGMQILVEVATAYAVTKVLLPVRVLVSVWGTPWFAMVFVRRFGGLIGRGKNMDRRTGWKIRGSGAAGTGATGGGVGPGGG